MSQHACYILRGGTFGICQGGATHITAIVVLCVREGSKREQCHLLGSQLAFSNFLYYPQANWALLVLIPQRVGLYTSRTLWASPTNSPVRLGVSPTTETPTGFFSQRFKALFPHIGTLGCTVCLTTQLFLPVYLHKNMGPPGPPSTLPCVFSAQATHPHPSYPTE